MNLLVCGWRDWPQSNAYPIRFILSTLFQYCGLPFTVIEGQAAGVDKIAGEWAEQMKKHGVQHRPFPADWVKYRRGAGPIRNRQMLRDGKPDLVLACHPRLMDSKGTADMVQIADEAFVPVWLFDGLSLKHKDRSTLF